MTPGRVVAWVVGSFVASVPVVAGAASAVVTVAAAEVRTAPHEVAPTMGTLVQGQQVTVSDQVTNGWRFVDLGGGRAGYVQDGQLQVTANDVASAAPSVEVAATSDPATPAPSSAAAAPAATSVAAAPATSVAAPVLPPRLAQRFFVRPDLNVTYKGDIAEIFGALADASSLGLTVGGNVLERLSIEATFGASAGSSSTSQSSGGTTTENVSGGVAAMAVARYAAFLSPGGGHALTFAVGPYALLSGGYGPTAFAHGEAAYEYRGQYVTFLVGYGANVVLNDSDRQALLCGFGSTCVVGFDRGDVLGHLRLSAGMTF